MPRRLGRRHTGRFARYVADDILAIPPWELRRPSADGASWLNVTGQPAPPPDTHPDRRLVVVRDRAGETLAQIEGDRRAANDERHLAAAVNACRLSLENARLHARLLA